jgi:hypothetical protein
MIMETTYTTSIDKKIEKLEQKAERIDDSNTIENNVDSATQSFGKLRERFESVEDVAEELAFHVRVFERVFDDTRPKSVDVSLSSAQNKVNITDEELFEAAENREFAALYEELSSVETDLKSARSQVKQEIKQTYQKPWEAELASARELTRIIGGRNDDFNQLIREIELFLTQEIDNPDNASRSLSDRWDKLTQRWDTNTGKHGWDAFREENGLAQTTIDELKQFSSEDTVRLSDLSLSTLEEIKTVEELESALEVRIKS